MSRHTIPVELYIEASQVFHWATKRHFQLWFTGEAKKRHRRTETVLRRLTKRGKLRSFLYGKKLVYASPRNVRGFDEFSGLTKVVHGLACTECLVRIYRSRPDGVIIAERFFYGLGSVPEWGIIYPNGVMLLLEFCTKSNFFFTNNMLSKLTAYKRNIGKIEEKFNSKAIILFVIDVPREVVNRFVLKNGLSAQDVPAVGSVAGALPNAMFTDYGSFLSIPIGSQLAAPIYFWIDGRPYPLSKNVRLEISQKSFVP